MDSTSKSLLDSHIQCIHDTTKSLTTLVKSMKKSDIFYGESRDIPKSCEQFYYYCEKKKDFHWHYKFVSSKNITYKLDPFEAIRRTMSNHNVDINIRSYGFKVHINSNQKLSSISCFDHDSLS